MKNCWFEELKEFRLVMRVIRISLNSSWHSLPMHVFWKYEINSFII
jgi:hypothetical protein